jgi:phosphoadenosine phosphosulfate reductase
MTAEEVLEQAVARHGSRLVLLCSFQKTSSVLVDMLVRISDQPRVATIDTGVLFPETLETWRRFEEHFGIGVEVHDALGPWTAANCCGDAKVEALDRALGGAEAWISGIRRGDESEARAGAQAIERDERRGLVKYNPLAEWTEKDVWRRIAERSLPYHPLHDQGYDSIGCMPCTVPGRGREGRWADSAKTECGIHVA